MDCHDARLLLDHGVEPGSRHPLRARLGFHLAGCPACRAYHEALHQNLLADLLFQHTPGSALAEPRPAARRKRRANPARRAAIVGAMLGVMLLLAARIAAPALTIGRNVQSYIVRPTPRAALAGDRPTALLQAEQPVPGSAAPTQAPPAPTAADPTPAQVVEQSQAVPTLLPIVPTPLGAAGPQIPTLPAITATPNLPAAGQAITVLLLGMDRRPAEQGAARTDTVIVARIDPALRRVALLSLPRDMVVEIPGYGYARINSAYVYGDLYPELGGGLTLARQTVSTLIGVPIDYAVVVDFNGFIGLIDAIGGIDINVPNALYDGQYPTMDYGYMEVYFETGPQHMDGNRALQYARIRHMDSDFERARRQQEVMIAAARRLREQNPLALLDSIATATSSLRGYVSTDIPEEKMVALAWALRDFAPDSVERYLVDENMISFNGEGGGCSSADDYWAGCVDPGAVRDLVRRWLGQSAE